MRHCLNLNPWKQFDETLHIQIEQSSTEQKVLVVVFVVPIDVFEFFCTPRTQSSDSQIF
jgi:hypothetical protein